ncbi:dipeptide/oligopeptide/nickel ABC transporter permease/ATP-binding protein [Kineococcus sp. R86509]|uniref:dipeptide/oligopeptide/nickel ABC transporter permease/ATP-binding protein n=1 Tax=Kineococcus sp. R86509 TaxID=3093851 RepID=UPI0036D37F2F
MAAETTPAQPVSATPGIPGSSGAGGGAAELVDARSGVLRRLLRNPLAMICIVYLLLVLFVGLLSPWLAPWGQNVTDLPATNAGPGTPNHLLGGDGSGRDLFSRLMWGARQTALACAVILVVSTLLGVTSGLIAGFYRGRFDALASFVSDVIMSLPGIVMLIALFAVTGPNIVAAMGVFGIIVAPGYFRLVRSIVLSVRNELYVDAAKVVGLSDVRIVGRHVLWAVRGPVIIQSSFVLAAGIGIEAGVTFLGLGDPTKASWGVVLQESFNNIFLNPLSVLWPAAVISLTILALVLLGNALSDVLGASGRTKVLTLRQRRQLLQRATNDRADRSHADRSHADRARADHDQRTPAVEDSLAIGSSDDVVLSVRDLHLGYPDGVGGIREVVHGVDLDVRRGEIHGLVGESGSGKSQIAFSTLGILPREALITSGSVLLHGEDLLASEKAMSTARGQRIAYVPQEPMSNLDPSFTIGAQLAYGLRAARPMSKAQARERLSALLRRVGITDPERVMKLYPHEISGGMAQRVLICGAVASEPDVIIADEPTTALDVTVQAEVLDLLRELRDERGLSMILVTHNLGVVADLCDTVSVMKDGNIVERADVEDLFAAPREPYTQELLASSRRVELMEVES